MSERAKSLDRLKLTAAKFPHLRHGQESSFGLSECPGCGRRTLKHEGGCTICTSCGWSACG